MGARSVGQTSSSPCWALLSMPTPCGPGLSIRGPPRGEPHVCCVLGGHRAMPPGPTQMKTRHPPTWRKTWTSSETSGPQVRVWVGGRGGAERTLPPGSGHSWVLGGQALLLGALQARVAFRLPPPLEMKMYSLAVTPNGHLEGRGSLPPPLIMRTAATPMPTPKSSPHLDAAPGPLDSRRGSSSSMDPQLGDQKSLVGTVPCPGLGAPSGSPPNTAP